MFTLFFGIKSETFFMCYKSGPVAAVGCIELPPNLVTRPQYIMDGSIVSRGSCLRQEYFETKRGYGPIDRVKSHDSKVALDLWA